MSTNTNKQDPFSATYFHSYSSWAKAAAAQDQQPVAVPPDGEALGVVVNIDDSINYDNPPSWTSLVGASSPAAGDMPTPVLKTHKKVVSKEPPIELNEAAKLANPWQPVANVDHFYQLRKDGIQVGIPDHGDMHILKASDNYNSLWIQGRLDSQGIFFNKKMRSRVYALCICQHIGWDDQPQKVLQILSCNDIRDWQQVKLANGWQKNLTPVSTVHFDEDTVFHA
jgi:hypothetical protein